MYRVCNFILFIYHQLTFGYHQRIRMVMGLSHAYSITWLTIITCTSFPPVFTLSKFLSATLTLPPFTLLLFHLTIFNILVQIHHSNSNWRLLSISKAGDVIHICGSNKEVSQVRLVIGFPPINCEALKSQAMGMNHCSAERLLSIVVTVARCECIWLMGFIVRC